MLSYTIIWSRISRGWHSPSPPKVYKLGQKRKRKKKRRERKEKIKELPILLYKEIATERKEPFDKELCLLSKYEYHFWNRDRLHIKNSTNLDVSNGNTYFWYFFLSSLDQNSLEKVRFMYFLNLHLVMRCRYLGMLMSNASDQL